MNYGRFSVYKSDFSGSLEFIKLIFRNCSQSFRVGGNISSIFGFRIQIYDFLGYFQESEENIPSICRVFWGNLQGFVATLLGFDGNLRLFFGADYNLVGS